MKETLLCAFPSKLLYGAIFAKSYGLNEAALDYERIYASMMKPAFIFDGRNILERKRLHEIGFNVFSTGKTPLPNV